MKICADCGFAPGPVPSTIGMAASNCSERRLLYVPVMNTRVLSVRFSVARPNIDLRSCGVIR